MEQTRNVLLLIFITAIMALVTSALLYFFDHLFSNLLLSEFESKIHSVIQVTIRQDMQVLHHINMN